MFAHMFRVEYFGDKLNCTNMPSNMTDVWECGNVTDTYWESVSMFLTDGVWGFESETFTIGEKGFHLKFVYAFVVGVLLLNIVIAVVSNKFTDVQNDAERVFWLHRLSLVQEFESLWTFLFSVCGFRSRNYDPINSNDVPINSNDVPIKSGTIKRFSFLVMPSQSEQERFLDDTVLQTFTDWWFSAKGQREKPVLFERMYMFYSYSNLDDVIFPGKAFERVFLGLKYDGSLKDKSEKKVKLISVGFVRIIAWVVFILHMLLAVVVFIAGLLFGIFWPEPMKKYMFHEDIYSKELSKTVSMQLQKMQGEIENLKSLLDRKHDRD